MLEVGSQIQEKVKAKLDEHQREYVLREQLRVIRQELGEDASDDELEDLIAKLDGAGLSPEARRVADRELQRLRADVAAVGRVPRGPHLPRGDRGAAVGPASHPTGST